MKKSLILVLILVASLLSLVSCGTDGPKPPAAPWIVGFWGQHTYAPYSLMTEIRANGMYYQYDNYDGTGLLGSDTWSLEGDALTLGGVGEITITKVSDNEYILPDPMNETIYRKGHEPGGNVFSQAATPLLENSQADGTFGLRRDMKLYSFTASSAGDYDITWSMDSGIAVAAYLSDHVTPLFLPAEETTHLVSLGAAQEICIVVESAYDAPYDFNIIVQPAG
jgi:hypothetical protein